MRQSKPVTISYIKRTDNKNHKKYIKSTGTRHKRLELIIVDTVMYEVDVILIADIHIEMENSGTRDRKK